MLLAMFVILAVSFFWTQYANPGSSKLAGVKTLLRNAADEMTLVLTDVEATQALSDWNPSVSVLQPAGALSQFKPKTSISISVSSVLQLCRQVPDPSILCEPLCRPDHAVVP